MLTISNENKFQTNQRIQLRFMFYHFHFTLFFLALYVARRKDFILMFCNKIAVKYCLSSPFKKMEEIK